MSKMPKKKNKPGTGLRSVHRLLARKLRNCGYRVTTKDNGGESCVIAVRVSPPPNTDLSGPSDGSAPRTG